MNTICIRSGEKCPSRRRRQAGTGQDRQPGSEIKSFLKDISYNFTLSRQWTWTLQVVCLAAAKEIGKKPRKNTQERKGTEGGAGAGTEQPLLYPRVSASCLKKQRQQEELRRRQQDKGRTQVVATHPSSLPAEANLHAPFKSIIVKYLFLNSPF